SKLEITGNKDIKTEDLMKGLREIGLTEGETFNRLELDRLTPELVRQYTTVASTTSASSRRSRISTATASPSRSP
ncbi:MAG: hypothetical protein IT478_12180, partial [Xanthomonadales bacterium]|nr:hypothetical protein [Xanthomonadales bacterium]